MQGHPAKESASTTFTRKPCQAVPVDDATLVEKHEPGHQDQPVARGPNRPQALEIPKERRYEGRNRRWGADEGGHILLGERTSQRDRSRPDLVPPGDRITEVQERLIRAAGKALHQRLCSLGGVRKETQTGDQEVLKAGGKQNAPFLWKTLNRLPEQPSEGFAVRKDELT